MHLLLLFVSRISVFTYLLHMSDCNQVMSMFIIIMVMVLHKGL